MTACSNCGRELPEGALFCPDCGTSAVGFSVAQSGMSPSHFNSGMTATSPPLTAEPPAPAGHSGSPALSSPSPEERRRSFFSGRRGLMLAVIAILAVLLVGTTFESGMLGSGKAPAINSASNPLTGGELLAAYAANETQATASYTNKTVYIQDSLDSGVGRDYSTGQYYSYVDSGSVILFWSSQSQLGQLSAGSTVLAKCSVNGEQLSPGSGYLLILQDCALVSVQSQTTASVSVSVNND
ncbi:MAG TPA: zinc ribbon domain-containing protein [Nitrososphaerales archaeon]|nr:zinc ribbon domain-containing protein [Nitrososphaerales archaeon]